MADLGVVFGIIGGILGGILLVGVGIGVGMYCWKVKKRKQRYLESCGNLRNNVLNYSSASSVQHPVPPSTLSSGVAAPLPSGPALHPPVAVEHHKARSQTIPPPYAPVVSSLPPAPIALTECAPMQTQEMEGYPAPTPEAAEEQPMDPLPTQDQTVQSRKDSGSRKGMTVQTQTSKEWSHEGSKQEEQAEGYEAVDIQKDAGNLEWKQAVQQSPKEQPKKEETPEGYEVIDQSAMRKLKSAA